MMESRIVLERMTFYGYHGCLDVEKIVGNWFYVDLSVDFDFSKAAETDNLNDTLDYSLLFRVVKAQMEIPSNLLEHLAGRVIRAIKENFPDIKGGQLSIAKEAPAMGGELKASMVIVKW